jgi:hypothetical protein
VGKEAMTPEASLRTIKILHTLVWAFFVACIIAIPVLGLLRYYHLALGVVGVVLVEVLILIVNGLRCPLTGVAAKYTEDRRDNFDIYLPLWVARHNKLIFGLLFLGGTLFTLARYLLAV